MNCQNCKTITEEGYSLCAACEMRFAGTLLRLAHDVTPLHDSLDATLHPGGHSPVRIQTATPPTPIRLEQRLEIGTCELCETMLTAGANDQWVTCPVCGREQRAQTVKLRRLKTLCWDDSKRGSAADIAKAFAEAGIKVSRKTITMWGQRDKLFRHADGYAYCDVYRLLIGPADLTVMA